MTPRALFRVDASTEVGWGHLSRCLTLAQELAREGVRSHFAVHTPGPEIRHWVEQYGFEMHTIESETGSDAGLKETLALCGGPLIVLDGHRFSSSYIQALAAPGRVVCCIDDLMDRSLPCDVLLNHGLPALSKRFDVPPHCTLLLGPEYAPVRHTFVEAREQRTSPPGERRLLITFGGSDLAGFTLVAMKTLQEESSLAKLDVRIIVGASNPKRASISSRLKRSSQPRMTLIESALDLAPHMAWADLALASGGSVLFELACIGVPTLVVETAENQHVAARAADAAGLCQNLGWHRDVTGARLATGLINLLDDEKQRKTMIETQRRRVDGKGAERVVTALMTKLKAAGAEF